MSLIGVMLTSLNRKGAVPSLFSESIFVWLDSFFLNCLIENWDKTIWSWSCLQNQKVFDDGFHCFSGPTGLLGHWFSSLVRFGHAYLSRNLSTSWKLASLFAWSSSFFLSLFYLFEVCILLVHAIPGLCLLFLIILIRGLSIALSLQSPPLFKKISLIHSVFLFPMPLISALALILSFLLLTLG